MFLKFMPKSLTSESLSKLLSAFSNDEAGAALAYTKLRDSLVRYFNLKGISEADEAADSTIDRVADKIAQNTKIEDITKFAFGVARNVYLERLRAVQVHSRAAEKIYSETKLFENPDDNDHFESLRECFKSLYRDEQKLLLEYFADLPANELFENRQKLAEREGVSLNALRIRVNRLRKLLEACLNGNS